MGSEMPDQVAKEFCFVANGIHGLYLDTASAIGNLAASCIDHHKKYLDQANASGQPAAARDAPNPIVVYTTQAGGEARPVHQTTLVDLIKRNQPSGRNMQRLGQMCVVALYQYWEDEFRPRLANALGRKPADLKHDTFGELRHLRRSVLHRNGRAVAECAQAKTLPRYTPGSDILLDRAAMDRIVSAVRQAAHEVAES